MPKPKKPTDTADNRHIADLEKQITELTRALQIERADATNIRRRHEEEISSLRARIKAQVIRELLPVIDNFERASNMYQKSWKAMTI